MTSVVRPLQRVLILSTEFPPGPGGIGTHAWQLARQLTRLGWGVQAAACQDYVSDAEIAGWNASQGFPIVRLPSQQRAIKLLWKRGRLLRRLLASSRPDLVVASGLTALWLAATQARITVPWVAIGHGSEFNLQPGWRRWLTRRALSSARCVVCVSEYTRELALQSGVQRAATRVILNGADPDAYFVEHEDAAAARRMLGDVEQLILTVGHVSERKAQDIVIRALPRVLASFPKAHYAIAGIPSLRARYAELAQELGVADHVHFLGRQTAEQLRAWFNACDVFVLTSRQTSSGDCEGFGIVAVEAALCGKPAVVTRDSGLAEAVIDGVTGLTVPRENPEATAEAICRLLGDPGFRRATGEAALRRARQELTWPCRVLEYDQLFRQLIGAEPTDQRVAEVCEADVT